MTYHLNCPLDCVHAFFGSWGLGKQLSKWKVLPLTMALGSDINKETQGKC